MLSRFLEKLYVNAAAVIAKANENNYEGENGSTWTKTYCTLISKLISVRWLKTFKNKIKFKKKIFVAFNLCYITKGLNTKLTGSQNNKAVLIPDI